MYIESCEKRESNCIIAKNVHILGTADKTLHIAIENLSEETEKFACLCMICLQTILLRTYSCENVPFARIENQSKDLKIHPYLEKPNYCIKLQCEMFFSQFQSFQQCPHLIRFFQAAM